MAKGNSGFDLKDAGNIPSGPKDLEKLGVPKAPAKTTMNEPDRKGIARNPSGG